jgi:hypothetical protein
MMWLELGFPHLLISQRPGALAQHSAGEADDGVEGRAQLMGDGRHKRRFLLQELWSVSPNRQESQQK